MRYGRITASKLWQAAHCKVKDSLMENVMGSRCAFDSLAMKRGRDLESTILEAISKYLKTTIRKPGIFLNNEYIMLGASPDGITEDYVIEIKSPYNIQTFNNYCKDGNICNKYRAQVQLQMLFAKKKSYFLCGPS